MFNLEKEIINWKKKLRKYQSIEDGYADELESHLRDLIDEHISRGISEEAFKIACKEIGDSEKISSEYYTEDTKALSKRPPWQDHPFIPSLIVNYFKIAARNIKRHKGHSFINIMGLSIGLAAFILISLYVNYELSFDKHHEKIDNIYRVYTQFLDHDHGGMDKMAISRYGVGPAIKDAMPEIENMFRFFRSYEVTFDYDDKKHFEETVFAADPSVFEMLDFNILEKQTQQLLETPSSLVITKSMANKLFGDEGALGKTLLFNGEHELVVEAIIEDIPATSHFHFNFLYSVKGFERVWGRDMFSWERGSCHTYLLLNKNTTPAKIEAKLSEFIDEYFSEERGHQHKYLLHLQNMADIHLYSNYNAEIESNNDIDNIYLFSAIAFMILFIASLNYINLTTAHSLKRGKEVAIRKTIGATRALLSRQFLSESIVIALIAFISSLVILFFILPSFNSYVERSFEFSDIFNEGFLLFVFFTTVLIGLVSGLYPAFIVSSYKPVSIFSGVFGSSQKGSLVRSIFVVIQFSISIALIVCTIVVDGQMKYIINADLGYQKDQIIVIKTPTNDFRNKLDIIKNELRNNSNFELVSSSSYLPNEILDQTDLKWPGMPEEIEIRTYAGFADYDWVDLFGIEIVSGRNFSKDYPSDAQGAFLINEAAVRATGWEEPIGKELIHWNNVTGKVVGVMKDFNFLSLHQEIVPLYIFFEPKVRNYYLTAKIAGGRIPETVEYLEEKWAEFMPGQPFEYSFFDEEFNAQYKDELKLQSLFKVFSFIAIFISTLGLLGLASYTTERRTKEIGVRKIMGADASNILIMFVREFTKWVVIANLIAWPVSYYFMNRWLNDFIYKIDLSIWIFLISGLIGLIVAVISVAYHSIKTAFSNPVEALKYE